MLHHQLFNDRSELYESARPTYPAQLFDYLAGLCDAHDLVWDCACGSGQAAISLADQFSRVYATDISEQQIKNAKKHTSISYAVAPSEQCELGDESCDLVCVAQALHWFDYNVFWPEVLRVLRPGGVFAAWGYNWPVLEGDLMAVFSEYVLDVVEPYWAPQNRLIWNHFKDIHFPFKAIDTPDIAMNITWNLEEFLNFVHTFSATRRCIDANGRDFFDQACGKAAAVWGDPHCRKTVPLDFVLYVGRKDV